jgi:hypothetical protein
VVGLLWGRTHLSAVQPLGVLHQVGKAFTWQQGWCGPQCVQLLWGPTHLSAARSRNWAAPGGQGFHAEGEGLGLVPGLLPAVSRGVGGVHVSAVSPCVRRSLLKSKAHRGPVLLWRVCGDVSVCQLCLPVCGLLC